jgi:hypothetical protein
MAEASAALIAVDRFHCGVAFAPPPRLIWNDGG